MKKIINECKAQGIFEQHREYIKAWLQHLDQKKFGKKLEKQLFEEVEKYKKTRDKKYQEKIIELVWNEAGTEAYIKEINVKK